MVWTYICATINAQKKIRDYTYKILIVVTSNEGIGRQPKENYTFYLLDTQFQ